MPQYTNDQILAILKPLIKTLSPECILYPTSPAFKKHSDPFAAHKQLNPKLVLVPDSTETLSTILAFVYQTDLDFAIRNQGFKSPSAHDIIISLGKFKDFKYDTETKLATIGTACTWAETVRYMDEVDPTHSLPVARTPAIGVGGTILTGGLSWMSGEYGCISDPINFIDAEVVKYDGTVIMASEEPDLLWGLRGGGGGLGVMTNIILRAHEYPTDIWSGLILVPRKWLTQLVDEMDKFVASAPHPRVTFFMYMLPEKLLPTILENPEPGSSDCIVFHVYDALGEEHGRVEFDWILSKEGAVDRTRVTNMKGVVDMQHNADSLRGTMKTMYAPMGLAHVSKDVLQRGIQWYDDLGQRDKVIQESSVFVYESLIMRSPIGGTSSVAWPRSSNFQHLILIIASCPGDSTQEQEDRLRQISIDAPGLILGDQLDDAEINPAGLEPYRDNKGVYREHYTRLRELRAKYDPKRRFKALV